jgi:hypothetical protein
MHTLSEILSNHTLCHMLNRGNTLVQLPRHLSFPPVNFNQLFHPLHSCFCHSLNRATWLCIICSFQTTLREFVDTVVNCFMRQALLTINRKYFCMNILCTELFCSQKCTVEHRSSVVLSSSTVTILTTETNL